MKNLTSFLMLSLLVWGCAQMEPEVLSGSGEVRVKAVLCEFLLGEYAQWQVGSRL